MAMENNKLKMEKLTVGEGPNHKRFLFVSFKTLFNSCNFENKSLLFACVVWHLILGLVMYRFLILQININVRVCSGFDRVINMTDLHI